MTLPILVPDLKLELSILDENIVHPTFELGVDPGLVHPHQKILEFGVVKCLDGPRMFGCGGHHLVEVSRLDVGAQRFDLEAIRRLVGDALDFEGKTAVHLPNVSNSARRARLRLAQTTRVDSRSFDPSFEQQVDLASMLVEGFTRGFSRSGE